MSDILEGCTPVPRIGTDRKQYFSYTCVSCGKENSRNTYCEPISSRMLAARECFLCDYWRDFENQRAPEAARMTIIDGHVYTPGNRTTGSFRGMAGRRFDIEYVEPSVYAGQRCTTFDLWAGSVIPEKRRAKFPDTARFLGAEKVQVGDTGCWNPTQTREPPYPLPNKLKENGGAGHAAPPQHLL